MRKIAFLLASAAACSPYRPSQTPLTPVHSAAGALASEFIDTGTGGMWIDSVGGIRLDATGTIRAPGAGRPIVGLKPEQITAMTASNVFAHVAMSDSVEIALSEWGLPRITNRLVADYARRMIDEHSNHRGIVAMMAATNGVTPARAVGDTADVFAATRAMARVAKEASGNDFDREFIGAQVILHRHMVQDLRLAQAGATGVTRLLIDQTLPVVEQHLTAAVQLWRERGGVQP